MKKIALGLGGVVLLGSMMLGNMVGAVTDPGILSITPGSGIGSGSVPLATTIGKILSAFFGVLGIIAVLLVIWSGFQWMTGGADGVGKAKERLKNAAIGLLLIMVAYALTNFVITALTTATQ